jgi:hypothetical protein
MSEEITSRRFLERLEALASPSGREVLRRHRGSGKGRHGEDDIAIGLRMAQVFGLAKQLARSNKAPEARRKQLFDLYLEAHGQDQFLGPG